MEIDWTAVLIAVAGIAGAVTAPAVAERLRRESVRREQLMTQRLEVYADVLAFGGSIVQAAMGWSMLKDDLPDPRLGDLDRHGSRMAVVASNDVFVAFNVMRGEALDFFNPMMPPAPHQWANEGERDAARAALQESLGTKLHAVAESYYRLEKLIRAEVRPS